MPYFGCLGQYLGAYKWVALSAWVEVQFWAYLWDRGSKALRSQALDSS